MCASVICESGSLVGIYKSPSGSLLNSTSWSFYVSGRLTKVHRLSKVLQVRFVSSHDALTTFIKPGKVLKTVITCVSAMVLNATFNNSSVISWRSVLLMEETRENYRPVASH